MEVPFHNLQDNLIYHANIFNYDKAYLMELINRRIKIDFSLFNMENQDDIASIISFLKMSSKDQITELSTLILQQAREEEKGMLEKENEEEEEEEEEEKKEISKEAAKTLRKILELLVFSYRKLEEKINENPDQEMAPDINMDNLICCLLYLDGISMVNIDIVKVITIQCPSTGLSLSELIFSILNNTKIDFHIREVASHILSLSLMNEEKNNNDEDNNIIKNSQDLINWTYRHFLEKKRESCLTSNLALILTIDENLEYFTKTFDEENKCIRQLFDLMMIPDTNINIIYESLFCFWNISNNKQYHSLFENKNEKCIEKIVQVIRTNKIDKVARIGLMTIKNLLDNQICVETLFDLKFMRTIDILLTNKWNDSLIRELLNQIYDFLDKNYKIMNSFDKFVKELDSGVLKQTSLHSTAFWEDNYKEFETDNFENIRKLVAIVSNKETPLDQKCFACFDIGEFARLYPGGAAILDFFHAKEALLELIQDKNLELKNRALVCLQKIMMKSLKK